MEVVGRLVCWSVIRKVTFQRCVLFRVCPYSMRLTDAEICPDCFWKLHHADYSSTIRKNGRVGSMGYSWTGGIWPIASIVISRDGSVVRLLRHWLSGIVRQCDRQGMLLDTTNMIWWTNNCSGTPKFFTFAPRHPSSWSASSQTCAASGHALSFWKPKAWRLWCRNKVNQWLDEWMHPTWNAVARRCAEWTKSFPSQFIPSSRSKKVGMTVPVQVPPQRPVVVVAPFPAAAEAEEEEEVKEEQRRSRSVPARFCNASTFFSISFSLLVDLWFPCRISSLDALTACLLACQQDYTSWTWTENGFFSVNMLVEVAFCFFFFISFPFLISHDFPCVWCQSWISRSPGHPLCMGTGV